MKDYPFVVYNNKKSVYNAVSYMIEKNYCQHIGIITGYDSGVTAKQRLAGYQEALSSKPDTIISLPTGFPTFSNLRYK